MSIQKCTSWLGHKFEARYSSEPLNEDRPKMTAAGARAIDAMLRIHSKLTYERDVCTRCGVTIERAQPDTDKE